MGTKRDTPIGPFSGSCYWCSALADSDEDIISQWIERELAPPPALVVGQPRLQKYEHGRVHRWHIQRLATKKIRVRAVCRRCNNGWMSRQETTVQPLLAPLIRGHGRRLSHQDQLEIAFWASIKSAVCDARPGSTDGGLASEATRESIYVQHRPPDDMLVRLAAYEGAYDVRLMSPWSVGQGSAGQPLAQWATTIVLGHLVVQVVGRTGSVHAHVLDQLSGGVHDGRSFTIWPPQPSSVEWPPREILTAETLVPFATELLPGVDLPDDSLFNGHQHPCPACGEEHGPFVRALPVPEATDT